MRVLVFGNMGYIGAVFTDYLRRECPDWDISGYDAGYFAQCVLPGLPFPEFSIGTQYFGDVRNFPDHVLDGVDAVVYLAAISNDPMGNLFEKETHDINQSCALTIAGISKQKKVTNFVFASSCSVYGLADESPRNEDSEVNPLTPYAKSKVNAEIGLKKLAGEGFRVSCLRFATACGFSPRLRLDLVLNDFVASAIVNKKIEILSDGSPWRPLIHVQDMARAIHWGIDQKKYDFVSVNVGSNEWNYQVKDLAYAVAKELGGVSVQINSNANPDRRSYKVDFSKFREIAPKHIPKVSLQESIRGLSEGLRNSQFSDINFRNSHLIRLKVLQTLIEKKHLTSSLRFS